MALSPAAILYTAAGNAIKAVQDGADYLLGVAAKIRNASGTIINPAKDESLQSVVDSGNSSTSQLGNGGTFVGTGVDCLGYMTVATTLHSDQDSAVDGMKFQFSLDGTNWDDTYSYTMDVSESGTRRFQFPVCARYFRINYTNSATTTTEFRCQTILQRRNLLTSIHRLKDVAHDDRSAQIMKAAIIAQREGIADQHFYAIQADVSGNLKVTTIGTDVPSDPADLVLEFAKNAGSEDMLVDGSTVSKNFEIGPTVTDEVWSIRELLLTFTADDFDFDGSSFGPIAKLTTGISINIVKDSSVKEIFVVKQNEDFLRLPGRTPLVNNTGPKDVLGAAIAFQGLVLDQAQGDVVRVIVQDDLDNVKLSYLTATLFAVKVS